MYMDDPRFTGMYDDAAGATFAREALHAYARSRMWSAPPLHQRAARQGMC
ncbi:hypothetical protein ACFV7Q_32680 [Streptomyces sp. NPDC059851]